MNSADLKNALTYDLEALKSLEVDIIPAREFYPALLVRWLIIFLLFLVIQLTSCALGYFKHSWEYAPRTTYSADFHASSNVKVQKEKLEDYKMRAWYEHQTIVIKMIGGVVCSSFLFSLFLIGLIRNIYIYTRSIQPLLVTGEYLFNKLKILILVFFTVFAGMNLITIPLFEQDVAFFSGIPCMIAAVFTVIMLANLEASRLGVSVLFKAISKFFSKNEPSHHA